MVNSAQMIDAAIGIAAMINQKEYRPCPTRERGWNSDFFFCFLLKA
jgi:hypothetical protein